MMSLYCSSALSFKLKNWGVQLFLAAQIAVKFCTDIHVPLRTDFLLGHHEVDIYGFKWNIVATIALITN